MSNKDQGKLVTMKQYAIRRLSSSEDKSKQTGSRSSISSPVVNGNGASQNGFIPNKEYGDWDRYVFS